jgi:hypothetical protein
VNIVKPTARLVTSQIPLNVLVVIQIKFFTRLNAFLIVQLFFSMTPVFVLLAILIVMLAKGILQVTVPDVWPLI